MIDPPIKKGIDIKKRMLTFKPCARASFAPQQTLQACDAAGSSAAASTVVETIRLTGPLLCTVRLPIL